MQYDYVIIGGGISGLYAMQEIHKKHKISRILVIDERKYWGGRLKTHKEPQYEIGGARFNDNHTLLLSLINEYKCKKVSINSKSHFYHVSNNNQVEYYHDANETLETIMKNIIGKSKLFSKKIIQQYTLKEWITYISKDKLIAKKIKDIFGYDSELTKMNAYDSLRSFEKDFIQNQFYVMEKGFSHLCELMVKSHDSKPNIQFISNLHATHVKKVSDDKYEISCKSTKTNEIVKYIGCRVIFALKARQLREFNILKPIYPALSCIYSAPLLRIYAIYPKVKGKVWFHDMSKIVTNHTLRQIIPINPDNGLIMISYTDGDDIEPFWKDKRNKVLKSERMIQKIIEQGLDVLFPHLSIPKPTYFKTHLWRIGCHHWKKKCDSSLVIKKIQNSLKDIYIIGEAFSQQQAWIEGALESVKSIL